MRLCTSHSALTPVKSWVPCGRAGQALSAKVLRWPQSWLHSPGLCADMVTAPHRDQLLSPSFLPELGGILSSPYSTESLLLTDNVRKSLQLFLLSWTGKQKMSLVFNFSSVTLVAQSFLCVSTVFCVSHFLVPDCDHRVSILYFWLDFIFRISLWRESICG